jgi:hypothetical protein
VVCSLVRLNVIFQDLAPCPFDNMRNTNKECFSDELPLQPLFCATRRKMHGETIDCLGFGPFIYLKFAFLVLVL